MSELLDFAAPIAAVLIGVMGVKYLFGDRRSLAGFIGFLILGIVAYAVIKWGIEWVGSLVDDVARVIVTLASELTWDAFAALMLLLIVVLSVIFLLTRARAGRQTNRDPYGHGAGGSIGQAYARPALTALEALREQHVPVPNRLQTQVQLALVVAGECGLLEPGSPVTPLHVAKWQVLMDRWPGLAAELRENPELLRILEEVPEEKFERGPELFQFLRSEPRLHPVAQHLVFLSSDPD